MKLGDLEEPSLKSIEPDAAFLHGTLVAAVSLSMSHRRGAVTPLSGTPGLRSSPMTLWWRHHLSSFFPGKRKGDGLWGQKEGFRLGYTPGSGRQSRKWAEDPWLRKVSSPLMEDELSSSGQGQGQFQRQRDGLGGL